MKKYILKAIALLVCVFSIYVMYLGNFTTLFIVLGTFGLILGAVINIYSSPKNFNDSVSSQRQVPNPNNKSLEDIYNTFKDTNTSMGKPWMASIGITKNDCIVWGPVDSGEYIYVFKMLNSFYVCTSNQPASINFGEADAVKFDNPIKEMEFFNDEALVCYTFYNHSLLDEFYYTINEYVKSGAINTLPVFQNTGKIYRFNENFTIKGQNFTISDFDGNELYKGMGIFPLKSFKIIYSKTGEEAVKLTKRIFHILPTYDFYLNGQKYGRFKKKLIFSHDRFVMETQEGELVMKSLNDQLGANYVVTLNGKLIGTIAERFNLSLHNIVFDNYIIYVTNEKYVALLSALGVMAAREARRDED